MRNDIPSGTMEKVNSKIQTISGNANPKLSLIISRKQTLLEDADLIEKKRTVKSTAGAVTDCGIAVCHPRHSAEDSAIWITFIRNGSLQVRCSENVYDLGSGGWNTINVGNIAATKCDLGFLTTKLGDEYITGIRPLIFYLASNEIYSLIYDEEEDEWVSSKVINATVTDFAVRRGPEGSLCLFYLKNGTIYHRTYESGAWSDRGSITALSNLTGISSYDLANVNGLGVIGYADGKMYQIAGLYSPSQSAYTWSSWIEVATADGAGAIVEYHDETIEAIYTHDKLCYKAYGLTWGEETELYDKSYSVIKSDNLNKGTLYMAMLTEDEEYSMVYLFRYVYMKDISTFTQDTSYTLQVDNSITQINANVKNINDSLYDSNATLFAPTSKLTLGVSYGNSDIIPMSVAYIDEVQHVAGMRGTIVSISARNVTGVFLHDLTFDDDFELTGTPSYIVGQIMDYFNVDDYEVDTSADEDESEIAQIYTIIAEPDKTPMSALEELAKMISEDASIGKTWLIEERYDGKIIIGFDDFRNSYIPKSFYSFHDKSDVFAKSVQRCNDGVYSQVRCTGITPDGKEIAVIYPVITWRYWSVGEHKTYHADKVEGITKSNLKKYAKALAKELKRTGLTYTYESILRPQLIIGDVAQIVSDDEKPERIGIITEITHTFGEKGFKTSFIIDSGGNIQENGALAYTANTKLNGKNRKTRITDFIPNSRFASRGSDFQTYTQDENFVETIRNIGLRLLDEPTEVTAEYDKTSNSIKIKWTDPADIETFEPVPCAWAGTVLVRNETGAPKHIWDGTIITTSTTRSQYSQNAYTDNNNIKKGNIYYYGIFPFYVALDDADHPIKYYRYTKVFSVRAGQDIEPPVITKLTVSGVEVTVKYEIKPLDTGSYTVIKLAVKKGSVPTSLEDADITFNLSASGHTKKVDELDENSKYYFIIYVVDDEDNSEISEPKDATTGTIQSYTFSYTGEIQEWTAPKAGIYKLETWGAQGGDATDGTNTARGGYGSYSVGEVALTAGDKLYINVGGQNGYGGGGSNS